MASSFIATVVLLTTLQLQSASVSGQNCYYPNGELSTAGDAACSDDEGACCPLNWQCMSNGLCFNPNEEIYGRYTCTDQEWGDSCPNICTQDLTASGNEAMLWCSSGDWCCDGNRSWDCCKKRGTDYFSLPDPRPIGFISEVPSPTLVSSSASSPAPRTSGSSSDPETSSTSSAATPSSKESTQFFTSTHETVTTGQNGQASTVTAVITQAADGSKPDKPSKDDSKLGATIGMALGIPLVLIICAILAFFFWRRHRKSKRDSSTAKPPSPPMEANYQNIPQGSHAPEIAGYPVASNGTKGDRTSELYGSERYLYSPTMSVNTSKSSPPGYSPNGTSNMAQIDEEQPQELWGGYVPYRPPKDEMGEGEAQDQRPSKAS